jgi:hypothetical protein
MASINKTKMTDIQICELGSTLVLLYDTEIFGKVWDLKIGRAHVW